MYNLRLFIALCIFLSAKVTTAQFLDVVNHQPYSSPYNLVRDHLTGPGIEILQIQLLGQNLGIGYFTGGDAAIGLNRGIVMSTGVAVTYNGLLGADQTGMDFANTDFDSGIYPEPLLQSLASGDLRDLVSFRITFRATGDSIRFRYVFASEEYPEFGCSNYNDIFGFFLQGPGYATPLNMALIPGSSMPVSINNIHPANPNNPSCTPLNVQYYHDNLDSPAQPTYDGYLDVFTAQAAVQPCGVYVMTLSLADIGDGLYDSAVFLEANSFLGNVDVAASFDPGEAVLPENAAADTIFLNFNNIPASLLPLNVTLGGSAENGIDYQFIDSVYTISSATASLPIVVQPIPDTLHELVETISFTVRDTGCFYRVFTIYLADADTTFNPLDSLVHTGNNLLSAPPATALNTLSWSVSNNTPVSINSAGLLKYSEVQVQAGGMSGGSFPIARFIDTALLESVCVNVAHSQVGDVKMYLFAPNGQFMELSSENGGSGANYNNTCFSPGATQAITYGLPSAPASAAPFSGSFQPEGKWTDLLDAPIDGIWKIGLLDVVPGTVGQLLDWTLSFSGAKLGKFQYQWSTGETGQTLLATHPGTYTVTISNALAAFSKTFVVYNTCSISDTINAVIVPGESYDFGGQILTQPGTYTQTLLASNGCDSIVYLQLSLLSNTAEANPESGLSFSPNPASSETLIQWENGVTYTRIRVFDTNGRLVFSEKMNAADRYHLNSSGWIRGWYIVEMEARGGGKTQGRLLIRD